MKQLAIVIVTYNSEEHIFDCVKEVIQHCDLPRDEVELIIVDNHSRQPQPMFTTLRALWGNDIICISNGTNGGYGQGNNLGIARATAPIVLIMNPDVRLTMPIFTVAVALFDKDPRLGMLGMQQMSSATRRSYHSFYPTWLCNGYLRYFLHGICNRLDLYLPALMAIQGSCFFVRREMFLAAGAFDGTHFMYGEEDDLHYRMRALFGNRAFAYNKHLRYIHAHGQRPPSLDYEKTLYLANVALYTKKGISEELIRRHFLQANTLLLIKERLTNRYSPSYTVLRTFRHFLQQ